MDFNLQKLFTDVFAPEPGDRLTIMIDMPGPGIPDTAAWAERRAMAADWHDRISGFSASLGLSVGPIYRYQATGVWAGELPSAGWQAGERVGLDDIASTSSILISMPQFSATPTLVSLTERYPGLRAASMPLVAPSMEQTALAADYSQIARKCSAIAREFDRSVGIDVLFSTGHRCYFDKSDGKPAREDNGLLHPGSPGLRMRNLPSGEVYVVPCEDSGSATSGELPVALGAEMAVLTIRHNRIVEVRGEGPNITRIREAFRSEPSLANIAEVAIGCNDKAVVWGNVLEDEKAGFHWAYGRSDFIGGSVGVSAFSSAQAATHRDIVYARNSRISCRELDFVQANGDREPGIRDGELVNELSVRAQAGH